MLRMLVGRLSGAGRVASRQALLVAVLAGVLSAPLAFAAGLGGGPIRGGVRNPSSNPAFSYTGETQIIADNSGYGTRQSNKGTGGGAIYGCRSPFGGNGCLTADNLNTGSAFAFISRGKVGGTITLIHPEGAPLTTNAKGVATGFNANYLQGKQASDFLTASQAASFAQTNQLLFAAVDENGKLGATRGATAAAQTGEKSYTVTFNASLSKCAVTASPLGAALSGGSIGVSVSSSKPDVVEVSAPSTLVKGFNLQVIC